MKHLPLILLVSLCAAPVLAQETRESIRDEYMRSRGQLLQDFGQERQQARQDYIEFRNRANADYADQLRAAWLQLKPQPAVPKPLDEPVPPVIYDEREQEPPTPAPVPIEEVLPAPAPEPQPEPVVPVIEQEEQRERTVTLTFHGCDVPLRVPKKGVSLHDTRNSTISDAWEQLADGRCDNLLYDCLQARSDLRLCDWAYLSLLRQASRQVTQDADAAVLLAAYLYAQSGYSMRMAVDESKHLHLLIASRYMLYGRDYYTLDGTPFYALEDIPGSVHICPATFEQEKRMTLLIPAQPRLPFLSAGERTLTSKQGLTATVTVNRNLLDFYDSYPTGYCDDDFGTRWAAYALTPLDETTRNELYPQLRKGLEGLSERDSVGRLLNWVQTAFVYEYDDKVWGGDRAFFAEESLHYPYCDCEDRSILFSRLVRDLIGLDVVLLYYPGHLSTAVAFREEVNGDWLSVNGRRYTVCDPTFINAGIGRTAPGNDNSTAKVILLR